MSLFPEPLISLRFEHLSILGEWRRPCSGRHHVGAADTAVAGSGPLRLFGSPHPRGRPPPAT